MQPTQLTTSAPCWRLAARETFRAWDGGAHSTKHNEL